MGPASLAMAQFDANGRLPSKLAGVQVLVNGIAAPLVYVSARQHAAILPFGLSTARDSEIVVTYNDVASNALSVPSANTSPGIFSADMSGSGQGAIQNSDGKYNSPDNPAAPGSIIVLYLSGLGPLLPAQPDGTIVPASPLPALQYPVEVTIGGQRAGIVYQGPAPEQVAGLYQVNCIIPLQTAPGPAAVQVTAGGRTSQPNVTVTVK